MLISLPQVAQKIGKSWSAAYATLLRGDLAAEQVDGRWYVHADELNRYLRDGPRRTALPDRATGAGADPDE